jgi:carbonic anhydrase/acetyltransferase-like protein (isoleucine patch superfamily)
MTAIYGRHLRQFADAAPIASPAVPIYALADVVPRIHPDAYVHPDAVVIGNVELGAEASVWPGAVLRGDEAGGIVVGARTSVQDGTVVHCTEELATTIGADCVIGHIAHLEGCTVHDGALVGNGAVVLHRAVIHSGALVGSNAVVPNGMEVPALAMALGVPAKLREGAVDPERMIRPGMESYLRRARRYRAELRPL